MARQARTSAPREAGGPGRAPPPRAQVSWLAPRVPCYLLGRRNPNPGAGPSLRGRGRGRWPGSRGRCSLLAGSQITFFR